MLIFIRTFQGGEIPLEVQPSDTIRIVKKKLQDKEGIRTDLQRLVFQNESLQNDRTLSNYGIGEQSVLHLVLRKYFSAIMCRRRMVKLWFYFKCTSVCPNSVKLDILITVKTLIRSGT